MKALKSIAIVKYKMMGNDRVSSVPAIEMIIILKSVIQSPLNAVPIVNLETVDPER